MGEDLIGAVLDGRYKVVERLAEGAMGVVYLGERLKLGRAVAIKFLHAWNAEDAAARKRFEVEARAMARLEHPHCAAVIDVGEYDGAPFVVMDYVRGTTLRDLLDEDAFEPGRAVEVMKQVLSGLAHAHDLGIVHRDIKPANIMLSEKTGLGEVVKILDFGLARLRGAPGGLTIGMAIGTPSYMAPEQILGGAIDARTDLYACGVLLFEMLTGRKPFVDDDPLEVLRMHREAPPPRLAEAAPGHEFGALEEVVARALAKQPDDRYASAADFAAALDAVTRARPMAGQQGAAVSAVARSSVDSSTATESAGRLPPGSGQALPSPTESAAAPVASPRDGSSRSGLSPAPAPGPAPVEGRTGVAGHRDPARRRVIVGVSVAVAGLAVIGIVAAVGGRSTHVAAIDAATTVAAPPDAPHPAGDLLARAQALLDDGDADGAIRLLDAARRTYPDRAEIPYQMGVIYFGRLWWSDGIKSFRAAIRIEPRYRSDPELIKTVLRGFITTPDTDAGLAAFLRDDIGAAAIPFLEETASSHPSPKVRARAGALLQRLR